MPILELQRRLHEAGRIRIGMKVPITSGPNAGKERPIKLDRFRFTSQSRRALDAVAALYGGDVTHWDDAPAGDQWEVITEARELEVVVLPERMSFSQNYEIWSGGGCQRRCDGEVESITDQPCICDPDNRACKPYTHLSLMLAKIPGIGQWRLTTHGYYAATELAGSIEMANVLVQAVGRSVLPGRLRVEAKSVKRLDDHDKVKTFNFPVPVLDFEVDMHALAVGGQPIAALAAVTRPELSEGVLDPASGAPSGLTPIPAAPAEATPSVSDQIAAVGSPPAERRRSNSPPPIQPTGLAPRPAIDAESSEAKPPPAPTPPPAPPVTADPAANRAAAVKKATDTAEQKVTGTTAKKAAGAKKAPSRAAPPVEHSSHLDNGELRITEPMHRNVMRLFNDFGVTDRPGRLHYCRSVTSRDGIESSWDISVAEAQELITHLKILTGEDAPPREGEDAA